MKPPALLGSAKVPGAIIQKRCDDDVRFKASVREGGYLYELDGKTYFSPNCRRLNVKAPPPLVNSNDGAIHGRDYDLAPFLQPSWWTKSHGYLAFVPLRPDLSPSPLHPLLRLPRIMYDRMGAFVYPERTAWNAWRDLQGKIVHSIHLLLHRSLAPAVRPAYPCTHVDNTSYKGPGSKAMLREDILSALSWFSIWFGCFAYAVAVSEAMAREATVLGRRILPQWMEVLSSDTASQPSSADASPVEERFVSDLPNTCLACFDPSIERVGTFVTIPDDDEPRSDEMVSIDWLCEFNVPVWYAWGPREVDITKRYPFWQRFGPTSRSVYVTPKSSPQISAPSAERDNVALSTKPRHFDVREEPLPAQRTWEPWFKDRSQRHAEILATQTNAQKERRESRLRCPPTSLKKTKFFVWDKDEDGVFRRRKAEDDDLCDLFDVDGRYCRTQARYDAVFNEWDLCEFFGVPDDQKLTHLAEDDADYLGVSFDNALARLKIYYGIIPVPIQPNPTPSPSSPCQDQPIDTDPPSADPPSAEPPSADQDQPIDTDPPSADPPSAEPPSASPSAVQTASNPPTFPPGDSQDSTLVASGGSTLAALHHSLDVAQYEPDLFAYILYGYTPLPVATDTSVPSVPMGYAAKALGYHTCQRDRGYWMEPVGQALIRFITALGKGAPPPDLWDLSRYNRMPVVSTPRFKSLRHHTDTVLAQVIDWDNVDGRSTRTVSQNATAYWFSIDYGQRWRLGCTSAAVALSICRSDANKTPIALAFDLIGQGVRFHTWQEVSHVPHITLTSSSRLIKFRKRLTVFDATDYDNYTRNCQSLFKTHIGRAALLRGGIIWRLAVSNVSTSDVLAGPSHHALEGKGIVRSNGHGGFLVDDALSIDEVDAICGHYDVYDERHLQVARFSWWPPADLWDQRYGFAGWSTDAEAFYVGRINEIQKDFKPLPRSEWRRRLKQSSQFKALVTNNESQSAALIDNPQAEKPPLHVAENSPPLSSAETAPPRPCANDTDVSLPSADITQLLSTANIGRFSAAIAGWHYGGAAQRAKPKISYPDLLALLTGDVTAIGGPYLPHDTFEFVTVCTLQDTKQLLEQPG
ncbi:hypothetical protein DFP72DRAFT_1072190 [Ephemerocybe angulata]|uniref:Uncharacterized protein n=2 Tax=Ephemerocybe angulata TaxID=980116 RepID=A0A8H6M3S4_9AGAR|nr:hypothetical protein DFP72DRAFT_1072190 [Tulosesus angulatus]